MILSTHHLVDFALSQYFKTVFEPDDVLEANIALDIRGLEQKVGYRKKTLQNLEVCELVIL